jgi:hypothetical protein
MLQEAYRDQVELETALNLAKSNLQLVQSNNEMLEEALKRETSSSKDLGWRRVSAREAEHRFSADLARNADQSYEYRRLDANSAIISPQISGRSAMSFFTPGVGQDSRFFKFRFSNGLSSMASPGANGHAHTLPFTSPSLPTLPSQQPNKDLEELTAELERERAAHKAVLKQKADLEAEIESLSQALFEEVRIPVNGNADCVVVMFYCIQANKMVATERIRRAETEEELKETRLEKEALKSALLVIEGENGRLRGVNVSTDDTISSTQPYSSLSRSSSRNAVKSRPSSASFERHSPRSLTSGHDPPASAPASYPYSPPLQPSEATSPAPTTSEGVTPQGLSVSDFPSPIASEESVTWPKRRPQQLESASFFPQAPFI